MKSGQHLLILFFLFLSDISILTPNKLTYCDSIGVEPPTKTSSGKLRERRGELTELDSKILGRETVRFLSANNTLILAHQGSAVTLSCRLNKTPYFGMVTWSRRLKEENSLQILSIGDFVHINDPRFLIAKKPQDNDWELRVVSVTRYDSGEYQCQANSHPPTFISTNLAVVDAFAEIQVEDKSIKKSASASAEKESGAPHEKFIKAGSELKLNCYLRKATEPPAFIFWYHNNTMVNYSPEQGRTVRTHDDGVGSTLVISSVESDDAGNYTCAPNNIHPHSVIINIMDTEGKYAAVHRDGTSRGANVKVELLVLSVLFICDKYVM